MGDVRTDVVKFESSVDSRNLHCQTNSRDSTSETAREQQVWALSERSPVMVAGSHRWPLESHTGYIVGSISLKPEDSFGQLGLKRLELGQQTVVENP